MCGTIRFCLEHPREFREGVATTTAQWLCKSSEGIATALSVTVSKREKEVTRSFFLFEILFLRLYVRVRIFYSAVKTQSKSRVLFKTHPTCVVYTKLTQVTNKWTFFNSSQLLSRALLNIWVYHRYANDGGCCHLIPRPSYDPVTRWHQIQPMTRKKISHLFIYFFPLSFLFKTIRSRGGDGVVDRRH